MLVDAPPFAIGTEKHRPGEFLLGCALLAVLAAAGHGFVLAAFGLWCRKWVCFLLHR